MHSSSGLTTWCRQTPPDAIYASGGSFFYREDLELTHALIRGNHTDPNVSKDFFRSCQEFTW